MEYTIENQYLSVTVSDKGAELQSVRGADKTEYLWQADPAVWDEKAPNIFPYTARLTEGSFIWNGQTYQMQIHGLVKYATLSLENRSERSMSFCLESSRETREQYPFDFIYRITYTLDGPALLIAIEVANTGKEQMYFAAGGHPGFRVPLEDGLRFEDYYLEFNRPSHPWRVGFTEACFLNGEDRPFALEDGRRISLRHSLFDQDAIVLKNAPHRVKLGSGKGRHSVIAEFPDFSYIGFWHMPKTEAPYVCIEPWSSLPSREGIVEDISCQSDLIGLGAGKTYETVWKLEFE